MSLSIPIHEQEKTFSTYNAAQGAKYANARPNYSNLVFDTILKLHDDTGGKRDLFVDVGTGPGNAARSLAPDFFRAIGLDPSEGMIATARSLGGKSASGEPIRFEIGSAIEIGQNLSPAVTDASVDLITAANAAHWFDMRAFWIAAARVLKPHGTVAIWTSGRPRIHSSNPNAAGIQKLVDDYEEKYLTPFKNEGNLLVRNNYVDLPLPWTISSSLPEDQHLLGAFNKDSFFRKDWGTDENLLEVHEIDLDRVEKVMHSGSPQTRYDEAHPDDVGTERDPVRILRRNIETLLHEGGMTTPKKTIKVKGHGVLLLVKRT